LACDIFIYLIFLKPQNYTKMAKLQLISQMKIMEFSFQLIKSVCNVSIIIQLNSFQILFSSNSVSAVKSIIWLYIICLINPFF